MVEGQELALDNLTSEGSEMLSQSARKARYKMKKIMRIKRGENLDKGAAPFQPPERHIAEKNRALEKIVGNLKRAMLRNALIRWRGGGSS